MAAENEVELAEQPRKRSKSKLVAFIVLGLVLNTGAVLGVLYALGMLPTLAPAGGTDSAEVETEAEAAKPEAVYVSFDPAFTVNFHQAGNARYLQLSLEAMTRDPQVEDSIKQHMPVIRNDLMLVFSGKSPEELRTRQGKQALQAETLASIQGILERETGDPGVEAVYFTNFVMQ